MTHEGIPTGDGDRAEVKEPALIAGPLDAIFIYHNIEGDTYHPVYYRERPMPGPIQPHDELSIVRLASHMHHTVGAETLEEAKQMLADMREQVAIDDLNVDSEHPVPWNGELGDIMVVPNWRKRGEERPFATLLEPVEQ
jgi:hypothetical protein